MFASVLGGVVATAILIAAFIGNRPASPASTTDGPAYSSDEDWGDVAIYAVQPDGSLDPEPTGRAAEVWRIFERIATPEYAAQVIYEYRVGDAPGSDTLAYVERSDEPGYWALADNLATSSDTPYLIATLIHEYAHLILWSTDEFDIADECELLAFSDGLCAHPDAILQAYHERFWHAYGSAAPGPDNVDSDIAERFYDAHPEDFVSAYAATNVAEDAAETFAAFVIEDIPDPQSSTVAAKLAFFAEYPELLAIRDRIRQEFAGQLEWRP